MSASLWWLLDSALEVLAPSACPGCRAPLEPGVGAAFCGACTGQLEPLGATRCPRCLEPAGPGPGCGCASAPPPYGRLYASYAWAPPLSDHIKRWKYHRDRALGRALGALCRLPGDQPADVLLVPVPLHPLRRVRRGFDQARSLALALSRSSGRPVLDALVRRRSTAAQARLDAGARAENLRSAFALAPAMAPRLTGQAVLLVDDVFTTGSTASACARQLLEAGARRVDVFTLARAGRPAPGPAESP